MVRFEPVLNVTDLIRDAILLLLQQINRHRTRVVGLPHPARQSRGSSSRYLLCGICVWEEYAW